MLCILECEANPEMLESLAKKYHPNQITVVHEIHFNPGRQEKWTIYVATGNYLKGVGATLHAAIIDLQGEPLSLKRVLP